MNSYAPTLEGVVGRLNEARLRLIAQGALRAASWALAIGLGVFIVLELLRRLLPVWWLGTFGAGDAVPVVAASIAGAVVLAVGAGLALLRAPQVDDLARQADRTFGLRERISTALEIERRSATNRPAVVAAMIADALKRSGEVSPAGLARFSLPRIALLVPIAAVAVVAVLMLVPALGIPVANMIETRLSETLDTDERASAAEDIRRVADIIEEQAISRDDAYMQAVANTLQDLGERIAVAPETTRGEILEELATLMDYATTAGREWRGTDGERIPQLIEALSESIAMPTPAEGLAPRVGEQAATDPSGPSAPASDTGDQQGSSGTLDSMLDELEERNQAARAGDEAIAGEQPHIADYMEVAKAQAAARREAAAKQQNLDNAQLLGPAADARAGDSRLAGEGTDVIGAEPIAQPVDFETSSELVLTGDDTGEGRRLDLEVTPNTNYTEITEQSLAANADAWERTTESEADRYAIGIDDRDAVSRYLRALLGPSQE